jgi:hypothetical protein
VEGDRHGQQHVGADELTRALKAQILNWHVKLRADVLLYMARKGQKMSTPLFDSMDIALDKLEHDMEVEAKRFHEEVALTREVQLPATMRVMREAHAQRSDRLRKVQERIEKMGAKGNGLPISTGSATGVQAQKPVEVQVQSEQTQLPLIPNPPDKSAF